MSLRPIVAVPRPCAGNRHAGGPARRSLSAAGCLLAVLLAAAPVCAQEPRLAAPAVEMPATEQTRALAEGLFAALEAGDAGPLLDHLADGLRWTVTGSSALAGIYDGKQAFLDGPYRRLAVLLQEPTHARVQRILVDGDAVAVQWLGSGPARNGRAYSNAYCWVVRFEGDRIVEATSYFDDASLDRLPTGGK